MQVRKNQMSQKGKNYKNTNEILLLGNGVVAYSCGNPKVESIFGAGNENRRQLRRGK